MNDLFYKQLYFKYKYKYLNLKKIGSGIYSKDNFQNLFQNLLNEERINKLLLCKEDIYEEIQNAFKINNIIYFSSSTGSGKTICLPTILHNLDLNGKKNQKIAVILPRRSLVSSIFNIYFNKYKNNVSYGIGIKYKNVDRQEYEENGSANIVFMTPGFYLNYYFTNEALNTNNNFDIIMIDEVHEINFDNILLISLLTKFQKKIILVSAINNFDFSLLNIENSQLITIIDKNIPLQYKIVDIDDDNKYKKYNDMKKLANLILKYHTKQLFSNNKPFLIFLSDVFLINSLGNILRFIKKYENEIIIKTFYSYKDDMEKEIEEINNSTNEKRYIIIATNIAESSITIKDLSLVIDTGIIRTTFLTEDNEDICFGLIPITNYSMIQRRGRLGRTCPGYYLNLICATKLSNIEILYCFTLLDILKFIKFKIKNNILIKFLDKNNIYYNNLIDIIIKHNLVNYNNNNIISKLQLIDIINNDYTNLNLTQNGIRFIDNHLENINEYIIFNLFNNYKEDIINSIPSLEKFINYTSQTNIFFRNLSNDDLLNIINFYCFTLIIMNRELYNLIENYNINKIILKNRRNIFVDISGNYNHTFIGLINLGLQILNNNKRDLNRFILNYKLENKVVNKIYENLLFYKNKILWHENFWQIITNDNIKEVFFEIIRNIFMNFLLKSINHIQGISYARTFSDLTNKYYRISSNIVNLNLYNGEEELQIFGGKLMNNLIYKKLLKNYNSDNETIDQSNEDTDNETNIKIKYFYNIDLVMYNKVGNINFNKSIFYKHLGLSDTSLSDIFKNFYINFKKTKWLCDFESINKTLNIIDDDYNYLSIIYNIIMNIFIKSDKNYMNIEDDEKDITNYLHLNHRDIKDINYNNLFWKDDEFYNKFRKNEIINITLSKSNIKELNDKASKGSTISDYLYTFMIVADKTFNKEIVNNDNNYKVICNYFYKYYAKNNGWLSYNESLDFPNWENLHEEQVGDFMESLMEYAYNEKKYEWIKHLLYHALTFVSISTKLEKNKFKLHFIQDTDTIKIKFNKWLNNLCHIILNSQNKIEFIENNLNDNNNYNLLFNFLLSIRITIIFSYLIHFNNLKTNEHNEFYIIDDIGIKWYYSFNIDNYYLCNYCNKEVLLIFNKNKLIGNNKLDENSKILNTTHLCPTCLLNDIFKYNNNELRKTDIDLLFKEINQDQIDNFESIINIISKKNIKWLKDNNINNNVIISIDNSNEYISASNLWFQKYLTFIPYNIDFVLIECNWDKIIHDHSVDIYDYTYILNDVDDNEISTIFTYKKFEHNFMNEWNQSKYKISINDYNKIFSDLLVNINIKLFIIKYVIVDLSNNINEYISAPILWFREYLIYNYILDFNWKKIIEDIELNKNYIYSFISINKRKIDCFNINENKIEIMDFIRLFINEYQSCMYRCNDIKNIHRNNSRKNININIFAQLDYDDDRELVLLNFYEKYILSPLKWIEECMIYYTDTDRLKLNFDDIKYKYKLIDINNNEYIIDNNELNINEFLIQIFSNNIKKFKRDLIFSLNKFKSSNRIVYQLFNDPNYYLIEFNNIN